MKHLTKINSENLGPPIVTRQSAPDLYCYADNCPNRWSIKTDGPGFCRWHFGTNSYIWPRITQEQFDAMTDQAMDGADQPVRVFSNHNTHSNQAVVEKQLQEFKAKFHGNPKDWAHKIIARHAAGELVHQATLKMARDAVGPL